MSIKPENILNGEAVEFLNALHHSFNSKRNELLALRREDEKRLQNGGIYPFHANTKIKNDPSWNVRKIPQVLEKRWVEITGPTEKKMMINALNSGAQIFMADFEDSLSPTWKNVIEGQMNLYEAVRGQLAFDSTDGKKYRLNQTLAELLVRPRGWHLVEKHFEVDKSPISGSLFDFGLYFFHNAKELIRQGKGPYFYLPKLENSLEASLWNDVFKFSEKYLQIPQGTIACTVLIETIPAVFEMEEILYNLKEYIVGLNAGRWDYIFSIIKKFSFKHFHFPDRSRITMEVPFMKAYTAHLIDVCHRRGAHALGGMAAFIPSRKDPELNKSALSKVKSDKVREVSEGFDGTWVAHPDLVQIALDVFENGLNSEPHQKKIKGHLKDEDLLNFNIANEHVTLEGIKQNITVAIQYLESWLRGVGAVGINNLMEDMATAEIARAQLWQWVHKETFLNSQPITLSQMSTWMEEEFQRLKQTDPSPERRWQIAYAFIKKIVESQVFIEFITLEAYEILSNED